MSKELAEATGGFDHSPDGSITERAEKARRELRESETNWEALVRKRREERDENPGLGRLRRDQVPLLLTSTDADWATAPLGEDEDKIGPGNQSPQL